MVTATLSYSEEQNSKNFSELTFKGNEEVRLMLGEVEYLLTMDKYEVQLAKIKLLKNIKEKKSQLIKQYMAYAKKLKSLSTFCEEDKKYQSLIKNVKKLKTENAAIVKKIDSISKNLFYTASEKRSIQLGIINALGFMNIKTENNNGITTNTYECSLSDEMLFERARQLINLRKGMQDWELVSIDAMAKDADAELCKGIN